MCIVGNATAAAGRGNIPLPFEGHRMLSLSLSNAFLLAEEQKITDLTILRQIHEA